MTLERHRSKLIPDVDFSLDGSVFVTDSEGTFPLRHGKKSRDPLPKELTNGGPPNGAMVEPLPDYDASSYLSYDPQRDKKRKYKPQEKVSRYGEEVKNMTLSSNGSQSLQRKLRRLKGQGSLDRKPGARGGEEPRIGRMGTWSSAGKDIKRKQNEFPRLDSASLPGKNKGRRSSGGAKSLDIGDIKAYKERMSGRKSTMLEMYKNNTGGLPLIKEQASAKARRLAEERLPGKLFIVCGLILLTIGGVKLLVCWWHEYFALLWTGFFLLCLGISGTTHSGEYFTKWRNGIYITLGLVSSMCVWACCGLLLQVLVPTITQLAMNTNATEIAENHVPFSNMHQTLAIQIPMTVMVWLNLGIDLAGFLLCLLNFFSLTGAMVAIGNHWDAVYKTTGECDHRGHPRAFNPFEQVALGQATLLMGILTVTLWQSTTYDHYWAPVWATFIVPLAGAVSLFFGKRPDSQALGVAALIIQPMTMAFLTVACVLSLLGILDDIDVVEAGGLDSPDKELRIASATTECIYVFFVLVNLIFVVGIVFRICRQICCPRCLEPEPMKHGSRVPSIA